MAASKTDASKTDASGTGAVTAPTQLLLDEPSLLEGALVIDAPSADVPSLSMAARHFSFFEDESFEGASLEQQVERGVAPARGGEANVVLYLPKGARRRDYALSLCAGLVGSGGAVLVVGERKGGIKGARSALRDGFEAVQVRRVGHHCQLLQAGRPKAAKITSSSDSMLDLLDPWELRWDTGLGFEAVSLPGTFAAGRLDEGTARLLEVCGARRAGRSLDLASGSGVIGVHLKRERPSDEWVLADADHLAALASRRTAALAGAHVEVLASDGYSKVAGRFECIVTNPPFHQGVGTDQSVPRRFVMGAPSKLTAEGELWLVANHFLPYEGWMNEAFDSVENVFEDSRFKVLVGRGPRVGEQRDAGDSQ